ncbi:agmatinase [Halomarina pelagica]|uniref:agmatinase n=1 Tax=Halomarina pelagica TaxID=2961599 RepID=UPI0020C585B8|nr:agmatinase [Halomarina sp. BND7]
MFPGALADRDDADYVLLGAPLDVSTSFQPGTRFGPDRVRTFSRTFDDFDHLTAAHFTELGVHDAGDLHAWDDAAEYLDFLGGTLADVRDDGALPLLLGGEHTVSIAGVRACAPATVVVLDAHLDLRREYDGNPLSHSTVVRHALDVAERAVIVGARTGSEAEWERAAADDVTVVPPEEAGEWAPDVEGPVYLSVDVDAADPAYAPGTGTMEPFGLTPREMHRIVRSLAPDCVGFDVVEVNDRDDGQAATLAGKLLRAFVFAHAAADA